MRPEVFDKLVVARLEFAKAVIAFHKAAMNDDALQDNLSKCEREYLAIVLGSVEESISQKRQLAGPARGQA